MEARHTVFLHYTQQELDRNYDQRGWCPSASDHIAQYATKSARARSLYRFSTIAYGSDPDEVFDFFPAARSSRRTMIFIHGGAWRNFNKDDYSFVAPSFVESDVNCAVLNFSKLPAKRLPDVVEQLRRGIEAIIEHADRGGVKASDLLLCGHSSGAHLCAVLLTQERYGVSRYFRAAAMISGSYDLEPALLSARGSYIKLDSTEQKSLSPVHHTDKLSIPVLCAYCAGDTDEFRRQSEEFAVEARKHGKLLDLVCFKEENHFSIIEQLGDSRSELFAAVMRTIGD